MTYLCPIETELEQILPLNEKPLSRWSNYCIYVAVFVVTHRGHADLLSRLLKSKVDIRFTLPSGRHPLSVAVNQGHLECTEEICKQVKFDLLYRSFYIDTVILTWQILYSVVIKEQS